MKLIVGLGNPGKEYAQTRHNAGFLALDEIKEKYEFPEFSINKKLQGQMNKGKINKSVAVLLKPDTFMNNSGFSVQSALNFLKIKAEDLVVIHDDKDIPLGETRVQKGRGTAGHNGVRSIVEQVGSNDFIRIRIGIAPMNEKILDTPNFVLEKFTSEEKDMLKKVLKNVTDEIRELL